MAIVLELHFVVAEICWMTSGLAMAPFDWVCFASPFYSSCCGVSMSFDCVCDATGPSIIEST